MFCAQHVNSGHWCDKNGSTPKQLQHSILRHVVSSPALQVNNYTTKKSPFTWVFKYFGQKCKTRFEPTLTN